MIFFLLKKLHFKCFRQKENPAIKETIKLKSLFNNQEENFIDMKTIIDNKNIMAENKETSVGSNSFEKGNDQKKHVKQLSFENSDGESGYELNNISLNKNKQNGFEFKTKIKEYEDLIKLLEIKEKKAKNQIKETEKIHNEKYHFLSQKYNELKDENENLKGEIITMNEVQIFFKHY